MDSFWLADPEDHDFPAPIDYLELLFTIEESKASAENLRKASTILKKAKDIFRASTLLCYHAKIFM